MESLKTFIINLIVTLIFISAIEIICPDNKMKKYIKFVLGILLMVVILNPIISFFTKGEVFLNEVISTYEDEMAVSALSSSDKENNNNYTNESFKENLNKNIISLLKDEFKDFNFECDTECNINNNFTFEKVDIYVTNKGVKKVKKVDINGNNSEVSDEENQTSKEIKEYLSNELEVSQDIINIYYE